ncbi:hypothetical protein [Haloarchaeobius sp. TZWWS8]|uniref:hypothetical protein n=1 Tax=Haloarchaeobius sp. TZWWS8 TaxID=3446121 RepID=UPI003EB89D77
MGEKTTVAFRIDEAVKKEWEEAAESPEYNSLSHLIRLSVQREIAGSGSSTTPTDEVPGADEEVLHSLTHIENMVEEVKDEIDAIGRETSSVARFDFEQVLLEILPTAPETYSPASKHDPDPPTVGETPRTVAGKINSDTSIVKETLEGLDKKIGSVRSSAGYYWRAE